MNYVTISVTPAVVKVGMIVLSVSVSVGIMLLSVSISVEMILLTVSISVGMISLSILVSMILSKLLSNRCYSWYLGIIANSRYKWLQNTIKMAIKLCLNLPIVLQASQWYWYETIWSNNLAKSLNCTEVQRWRRKVQDCEN